MPIWVEVAEIGINGQARLDEVDPHGLISIYVPVANLPMGTREDDKFMVIIKKVMDEE